MISGSFDFRKITAHLLLGVSIICWILLLVDPGGLLAIKHCPVTDMGPSPAFLQMLLAMNPVAPILFGWTLMVLAMMLPKVIAPVLYICHKSFKHRRLRSASLFLIAYTSIWVLSGLLLIALIFGLNLWLPNPYLRVALIGGIALIWQCSPVKQRCLNEGHNHPSLAAFGLAADRDAFSFGIHHGCWCVGSGWAIMLFPMLLPAGHNVAMLAVTVLMISEHLEHPKIPRWRINFSGKLLRGLYAQTGIRVQQLRLRF